MYVRIDGDNTVIDSVVAVEGKFKYRPDMDSVPSVEVTMVYANSATKTTYGTCPISTFSPRTLEALLEFLRCAEQDFGEVVFKGGILNPFGPIASQEGAESNEGLPKGLGEESS
jgi:hypothetical protein